MNKSTKKGLVASGSIWKRNQVTRRRVIQRVCQCLTVAHGCPRLGNPRDPLDDLVYIIISNKTTASTAQRVYRDLKARFPCWRDMIGNGRALRSILRPAGLSTVKSAQLVRAVTQIDHDIGTCDLRSLRNLPPERAEKYLCSLSGVSTKVARCIMMYTMNARVLPVDSHVHRVASRLGWTARKRADQCHQELEALVPPSRRFAFHVDCIVLGRTVCRPRHPRCTQCCISGYCPSSRAKHGS